MRATPDLANRQKRIRTTLFSAQAAGSAGFLVASTVTPIVGAHLSGHASWAGVPTAVYWAGGAAFAPFWGRLMESLGRRRTLVAGLLLGVAGALVASYATTRATFAGFLGGLVLMGGANSALQLARFMAGEAHELAARGRAIAIVVLGGTVGAVLGPALVAPASAIFAAWGLEALGGPYAASAVFFSLGAFVVFSRLRPDPREIAFEVASAAAATGDASPGASANPPRPLGVVLRDGKTRAAILTLATAQAVMVMLMVITSLHMSHHQHSLASISGVMSSHVLGMYAFSTISGRLADSWGRGPVIATGGALLTVAGLGAMPSVAVLPLGVALFLLGLGWNFCYVAGSALLADRLTPSERPRVQALNDSLLTVMAGAGSAFSGVVFSRSGYSAMGALAAICALLPLALGLRVNRAR
jgi:MFS family permease